VDEEKPEVPKYHVLDGGSLLHIFPWKKGATFYEIVNTYVCSIIGKLQNPHYRNLMDIHPPPLKIYHTHQMRVKGPKVLVTGNMTLRTKKDLFLSNPEHKQNIV
jgi:hypothetical protein